MKLEPIIRILIETGGVKKMRAMVSLVFLLLIMGCTGLKKVDHQYQNLEDVQLTIINEEEWQQKADAMRGGVRSAVRSTIPRARNCYTQALKKNKELSGKIILKWEFDDKGTVTNVAVDKSEMSSHDSEFETCLMDTIKQTKFPQGHEASVRYPFSFSRK